MGCNHSKGVKCTGKERQLLGLYVICVVGGFAQDVFILIEAFFGNNQKIFT